MNLYDLHGFGYILESIFILCHLCLKIFYVLFLYLKERETAQLRRGTERLQGVSTEPAQSLEQ